MTVFNFSLRLQFMVATGLGVLAATLYVPAMPDMARDLGAPLGQVQASLSLYLLALGLCMPVAGPFSDRVGRRRPFIAGFAIYVAGSLLCAAAQDITTLYAGRLLQAVGACLTLTITRAIVRDLSTGSDSARVLALIAMTTAVVPATAPLIGAHINALAGWRFAFLLLALIAAVAGLASWRRLKETLPQRSSGPQSMLRDLTALMVDQRFLGCSLVLFGVGGGFYSFIASAPIVLIAGLGASESVYGLSVSGPPLCFITGNYIVSRLSGRVGMPRLIAIGTTLLATGAVVGMIINSTLTFSFAAAIPAFMLPVMVYGLGNGLIVANAYALSMGRHGGRAATASGVANLMQVGGGAVGTLVISLLPHQNAASVFIVIAGFSTIAVLSYWLLIRPTLAAPV